MKGRNSLSYLAVAYASLGNIDKAKEVLEQIALRSRDSVEKFFKNESYKDQTRNEKLLSVLEKIPTGAQSLVYVTLSQSNVLMETVEETIVHDLSSSLDW